MGGNCGLDPARDERNCVGGFKESSIEGIGLRNVRERLRVAYGQRASIQISSAGTGGTSVVVQMPVERGQARV